MSDRTRIMREYLAQELGKQGKEFIETEDTGDCFFDAVAQTLTVLNRKEISMEEVRIVCHEYIQKLNEEEPDENWRDATTAKIVSKAFGVKVVSYSVMSYEIDSTELSCVDLLSKCYDEKRVIRPFDKEVYDPRQGKMTVQAHEVVTELDRTEYDERASKTPNNQTIEIASYQADATGHVLGVGRIG